MSEAVTKRGRGRPSKGSVPLTTTLDPDVHALWKASGLTLTAFIRTLLDARTAHE